MWAMESIAQAFLPLSLSRFFNIASIDIRRESTCGNVKAPFHHEKLSLELQRGSWRVYSEWENQSRRDREYFASFALFADPRDVCSVGHTVLMELFSRDDLFGDIHVSTPKSSIVYPSIAAHPIQGEHLHS